MDIHFQEGFKPKGLGPKEWWNMSEARLKSLIDPACLPQHLAVIMDGNGRWAANRHLPRIAGHRHGISAVSEVVTAARELGIRFLTLYAFSTENWHRPTLEVSQLMRLLAHYLKKELHVLMEQQTRLVAIGQIERLPRPVVNLLKSVENKTRDNPGMTLILALSYSGRAEIVDAVRRLYNDLPDCTRPLDDLSEERFARYLYTGDIPDPDLLIRTSGEVRISNFFLWQLAYTELYFTQTLWPDFTRKALFMALLDYQSRERRFGQVLQKQPATGIPSKKNSSLMRDPFKRPK